jgi:hypothetical protein
VTTGQVTLDGTLLVTLLNGFVPDAGDSFQVLTFASRQGDFATPPDGFDLNYDDLSLTLVAQ